MKNRVIFFILKSIKYLFINSIKFSTQQLRYWTYRNSVIRNLFLKYLFINSIKFSDQKPISKFIGVLKSQFSQVQRALILFVGCAFFSPL